jgi:hypothetical protein
VSRKSEQRLMGLAVFEVSQTDRGAEAARRIGERASEGAGATFVAK